ncbi:phospholipase effector Tle1 domain-containing protein, partial [Capnocytophaga granulosa]|uniref:phospholipase effector Tle1 domain-containing protein n=1 Tax=Capnocytophaga granulosa TaxID=45242 RepID=UPI00361EABBA
MGKTFVYNSGSYKKENDGVLSMEFGIFFDGTANNLYNTDARKYMTYKKIEKGKLSKRAKEELERIEIDYSQQVGGLIKYILPQQTPTLSPTIESTDTPHKYTLDQLSKGYKKYGKENVSYGNDHTNVARMYLNADRQDYAIYIEGVGTKDLEGDYSLRGISYADGVTGLLAKVKKGSEELVQKIKMLYDREKGKKGKKNQKLSLTLDVFGFSRGAAAARHFLFQVSHNKHLNMETQAARNNFLDNMIEVPESELVIAMKKEKILAPFAKNITINIRFVGLYDTVASFNPYSWDLAANRITEAIST